MSEQGEGIIQDTESSSISSTLQSTVSRRSSHQDPAVAFIAPSSPGSLLSGPQVFVATVLQEHELSPLASPAHPSYGALETRADSPAETPEAEHSQDIYVKGTSCTEEGSP